MTVRMFAGAACAGVLATLMFLSGCAGTPPVFEQRYLLPITAVPVAPPEDAARRLSIEPLRLAPFLQSDGIVMQTGAVTIHQGSNHLWAEDLSTQLQRMLRQELARKLRHVRLLDDGDPTPAAGPLRRLEVEVDAFHGRYDGMAVVAGQWWLRDGEGRLLTSRPFLIEQPLQADGYQALVKSLAAAWQSVTGEIAQALAAGW
ncbi:MAG: ABC-type transport auxiliary lipoprotein family protein [Nitrococcus sp.]|nr:ABC-type transport auxiliary lipoprotein family protein [Nitrococcus sp.]